MTREDIIKLAREAKGHPYTNKYAPGETAFAFSIDRLETFVALIVAAERSVQKNTLRKPLTDEEVGKVAAPYYGTMGFRVEAFARAIEKAHGIGE